jgi:hypothetical protein
MLDADGEIRSSNLGRVGHMKRNAYWWHGGCYYSYPNGAWVQIQPNYFAY